jgi:glycosyltransferase involved in cell wall biosynthesis
VVDDGAEDYAPLFDAIPPDRLVYHREPKRAEATLGTLRNLSLDLARGELVAQWDDDDWYHPDRLTRQVAALDTRFDACVLSATLMHLDAPEWRDYPYIGHLPRGVPGTILHRASPAIRYPAQRRGEDSVFLHQWPRARLTVLDAPELFLRAFHGANTWERAHFERRVRNSVPAQIEYWLRRALRHRVFDHSRFNLKPVERDAFTRFQAQNERLGL